MAKDTTIQWADTSVNPIMGCGGCELFPSPGVILDKINIAIYDLCGEHFDSRKVFKELVDDVFSRSLPAFCDPAHKQAVNTTNIYHLRKRFFDRVTALHGADAAIFADAIIEQSVTCYAGKLHLRWGTNVLDREGRLKPRKPNKGYAPIFESLIRVKGRAKEVACYKDLSGVERVDAPWKNGLPRLIFVSDMGDAFSTVADFDFLKTDLMPAIESDEGQRHLWLWLTKRPGTMAKFADQIGGFPENVCAMTTLTGPDDENLGRLAAIKSVKAAMRGLSIEPLWDRIPPSALDLDGIDWVIVGGESGSGDLTRPFSLEWAEELRDHCQEQGVAFFMKQLGRMPEKGPRPLVLKDAHGGDWFEWDDALRVRQFPKAFHDYGKDRKSGVFPKRSDKVSSTPSMSSTVVEGLTASDLTDFERLDSVVRGGLRAFIECGKALAEIHERQLWKAVSGATWESYCRNVAGLSKPHAHRLVGAARIAMELESLPIGNDLRPVSESQVRPLQRLDTIEKQAKAWEAAVTKAGGQPTARDVVEAVFEILQPEQPTEPRLSKSQRRVDLVSRLKTVIQQRESWDEVERMLDELEGLM
jgi:protein gp37